MAAPSVATAIATATGAQQDRAGRIEVREDLAVPDHPEIMVTGDVMSLNKLPGVCEVAMQTGIYAAQRIKHEVAGRMATKPFRYHDLGSAAYLSRGNAVVSVRRLEPGSFGWIVWLFIHIGFLTGWRNRVGAVLNWWPAFVRDVRRERTYTTERVGVIADAYDVLSPAITGTALPAGATVRIEHPRGQHRALWPNGISPAEMSDFEVSAGRSGGLSDRVKHISRRGAADRLGALNNISPAQVRGGGQ